MATIASLLVNLGMNSASFEAGSKRAGGALRGISREVAGVQRSLSTLKNLAATALIGGGLVSGMRSIVREVESASKVAGGLAKISEAYHVDPSSIIAATKSFRELEHTVKGLLIGVLAELAPVMTNIARIVRQVAEGFGAFARQTFGSIGNLVRLVGSCYVFIKAAALAAAAVRAIVAAKLAWVSVTVLLQSVTGVGLVKALAGLAVGTAAVVALNLGFNKMVDSAREAQTQVRSLSEIQRTIGSIGGQDIKGLQEQAEALREQYRMCRGILLEQSRSNQYNVDAVLFYEKSLTMIRGSLAGISKLRQEYLNMVSAARQHNKLLEDQDSIIDGIGRRFAIAYNMARHGVSENIAALMAAGAPKDVIASAKEWERMTAKLEATKGIARTAEANRKSVDDMIAGLKRHYLVLKNSELAVLLYDAKMKGATGSQLNFISKLYASNKNLETVNKTALNTAATLERMKTAGEALRMAMLSPYEALIERLKEFQKMVKAGAISAVTFGRAVRGAMGEYGRMAGGGFGTYRLGNPLISIESLKTGGGMSQIELLRQLHKDNEIDHGLLKRVAGAVERTA